MKLIKSKKGMVLYYLVIFGFIMALVYYLTLSLYIKPAQQSGFPGEFQLKFLEETAKAEGLKFYVEQTAKESAKEAAINLASRGGFKDPIEALRCGFFLDYNYWNKGNSWCRPDYKENFKIALNNIFSEQIKNLTQGEISYDYFVKNETIVGVADGLIEERFFPPALEGFAQPVLGGYLLRPSFNVKVNYNLEEYTELFKQAELLVSHCQGQSDLDSCIKENLKVFNEREDAFGVKLPAHLQWQLGDCEERGFQPGGLVRLFCIRGAFYRVFDASEKSFVDKPVKYRLGLDFNQSTTV